MKNPNITTIQSNEELKYSSPALSNNYRTFSRPARLQMEKPLTNILMEANDNLELAYIPLSPISILHH